MPPLLFVHGMWSRPSTFATLRSELEAAGLASAAITLPFHDVPQASPPPPGLSGLSVSAYVDALVAEAAALPEPPVLVGHSMGGLIVQLAAPRIPNRGLVLLATAPSEQASRLSWPAVTTLWPITSRWGWWRGATLLDATSAAHGVFNGVPDHEAAPAIAELTWDSGHALREIAFPWSVGGHTTRVTGQGIERPALVITGSADRIVPPATSRATARLLAGAGVRVDYEEWAGIGHWLFHDAVRPRLAAALARFLATV